MSKADKLLANMRNNPRDWRIEDLEAVAARNDITTRNPASSHVVFTKPGCPLVVSVPAKRPIKPIYITKFLELLDWELE
jgi:hypothetical protein